VELDALVAEGDGHDLSEDPNGAPWVRALVDGTGERWVSEAELDRVAARSAAVDAAAVLAGGEPEEEVTIAQAARVLGVSVRYLQGCARYWEEHARSIEALVAAGLRPTRAWLAATRSREGAQAPFRVTREEVAAFADRRQRPVVRVGYDVTLSTEKSIAVLALLSQGDRQRQVLSAIEGGVRRRFMVDTVAPVGG